MDSPKIIPAPRICPRLAVAKSSALKALLEEMKTKNNYFNESSENLIFGINSKNMSSRIENLNCNNNNNANYNDYSSKTARTNDFMIQNENINNAYKNNLSSNVNNNNSGKIRNISVDSANSNADLIFDDMKNEIDNLQNKIDGLEKKLCK